jgi:hypothetical protein
VYFMTLWVMSASGCVGSLNNIRIACSSSAFSLTVDEHHARFYVGVLGLGEIRGYNFDGTGGAILYSMPGWSAYGPDVDPIHQKLYWAESVTAESRILRADILANGYVLGNPDTVVTESGIVIDVELDVDGGKMYWIAWDQQRVRRANLDGSGVETIAESSSEPSGIAFDRNNQKVYWVGAHARVTIVERANPDGSGREELFRIPNTEYFYLDLGDMPVSVETKSWGQIKRLYQDQNK